MCVVCAWKPTRRWALKYLWQQQKAIKRQCQYASGQLGAAATESRLNESAGHLVANLIHSASDPCSSNLFATELIDIESGLYLQVHHIIMLQTESTAIICMESK